jgi:thymidylate synthase (FAD)
MSNVKLISVTGSKDFTPEELIVYCARVSNPENQNNMETAPKLINYLIKHKHWSPFEMVDFTVEIKTTRGIAAQILRHRSFSFQEFCIAKDSLITLYYPETKNFKKITIENLYKRYKSSYWNRFKTPKVKVYDEKSKTFISAEIKEVFQTGIKPLYEIKLANGKSIKSTLEHKFFTKNGFSELANLQIGDYIAVNGVPCYQNKEWLAKTKLESLDKNGLNYIAEKANISYHTIRKWLKIYSLSYSRKEISLYTKIWNKGLEKEKQPMFNKTHNLETRLKMKDSSRKEENSNLYTGNEQSWRKKVANECAKYKSQLAVKQNINFKDLHLYEIDHILPVYSNPELAFDLNNLQLLKKEEHKIKSLKENIESKKTIGFSQIISIEYVGDDMTYDLEVNHVSHNYIANGIVTHNSQRYSKATKIIVPELRQSGATNRQSSLEPINNDELNSKVRAYLEISKVLYDELIEKGVAKECARAILPLNTETTLFMKGSVRSWIHYLQIRCEDATQLEHRLIALEIKEIFKTLFPNIKID